MNNTHFDATIDLIVKDHALPGLQRGDDGRWLLNNQEEGYGLSMFVAGAISIAIESNPDWSPHQLVKWLTAPSKQLDELSPLDHLKKHNQLSFDLMRQAAA